MAVLIKTNLNHGSSIKWVDAHYVLILNSKWCDHWRWWWSPWTGHPRGFVFCIFISPQKWKSVVPHVQVEICIQWRLHQDDLSMSPLRNVHHKVPPSGRGCRCWHHWQQMSTKVDIGTVLENSKAAGFLWGALARYRASSPRCNFAVSARLHSKNNFSCPSQSHQRPFSTIAPHAVGPHLTCNHEAPVKPLRFTPRLASAPFLLCMYSRSCRKTCHTHRALFHHLILFCMYSSLFALSLSPCSI